MTWTRRHLARIRVRLILCATASFAVVWGCTDLNQTSGPPDVTGQWTVSLINENPLPTVIGIVEITEGSLHLDPDHSFRFDLLGVQEGSVWSESSGGTWTQTNEAILLNPREGCSNTLIVKSRRELELLATCDDGLAIVFTRGP